jgi:hypothetical protein
VIWQSTFGGWSSIKNGYLILDSDSDSCMRVKLGLQRPCKYFASFLHTSPYSISPRTKENLTAKMTTINKTAHPFDKVRLEALLNRRFFYAPAFEIYGGMRIWLLATMKTKELIEPFHPRCRWSIRLRPARLVSSGQYHCRMAKALHHPREHA